MTALRRIVAVLLAVIVLASAAALVRAETNWTTSLKTAVALARKNNKPILIDFTGSDWCPYCKKLHAEVFDKPGFATWAADNVVLLECDFPRGQQPPKEIKDQNAELAKKYTIQGYPTVVFIDAEGTELGRSGYINNGVGGEGVWIDAASQILRNRPKPPKPPEVKFAASLPEALKAAQDAGKPLLLVATSSKSTAADALIKNPDFIRIANARTVAVLLKLPLADDSDEAKAHDGLVRDLKLFPAQGVALIDVAAGKIQYRAAGPLPTAEVLLPELRKALPALKYDGSWLEDYALAQELSAQLKRPMLLDFTGSDWCIWCHKLDGETFSTDAFKKFAADKLILVKLDFPHQKPQSDALKQQNAELNAQFSIPGYPTVLLIYSGKTLARLGYQEGGPDPFIAAVKKALPGK